MTGHRLVAVALLAAYVVLMLVLARLGRRRTRTLADYYVGGRSLGGVVLGLSFFATYASTNSYLGFSGKAYAYGAPWLLMVPFAVGLSAISWWFVAPRMRAVTGTLDSVTLPDYIGFRFESGAARLVAALIVLFASVLYMTAVYKGIGNLLEAVLGVSYVAAIGLVLIIVVLYTAVGGFHSVVRTDAVQATIMIVAAILMFRAIAGAAGGFAGLESLRREPESAHLFRWDAELPIGVLLGILFAATVKFLVEPRQLSRFYALADRRAARTGIWVSTLCFAIVFSLLTPIGLFARRLIPELSDTDLVVPILLAGGEVFGPLTSALLMLAMLAAAMSSLDSVLLVMASTAERDLVARLTGDPDESTSLLRTRWLVVVFAATTALIALRPPGGIVALTAFSGALYGACFLPAVVLGLYWRRGNGAAVLTSFGLGITTLLAWRLVPLQLHAVFPAIGVSLLGYTVVAALTPPSSAEALRDLTITG